MVLPVCMGNWLGLVGAAVCSGEVGAGWADLQGFHLAGQVAEWVRERVRVGE